MNKPTNVLICGLNWSGSGAVFDLLKEYSNEVVPVSGGALDFAAEGGLRLMGEFEVFRSAGFIADYLIGNEDLFNLGHAQSTLRKQILSFRVKSLRFFSKLRNLQDVKNSYRVYKQVIKTKQSLITLLARLHETNDHDERLKLARKWLEKVIDIVDAKDKKAVVFDQGIHLGQHIDVWPGFYNPFKLIIVHRDPRDVFAEQEKYKYLFRQQISSNEISLYGPSLEDAVRYRADVTFARMKQVDDVLSKVDQNNVLLLRFEDLVKDYDNVKNKIEKFIGVSPEDHIEQKRYFDPAKSIKNIGVFNRATIKVPDNLMNRLSDWYNNH